MSQKPKLILALFGLIIAGALAAAVIPALQHRGKLPIQLKVSPPDSTVTMDGKPVKAGVLWLEKGSHEFKASHEHFYTLSKTVNTDQLHPNDIISLLLEPSDAEGEKMLEGDSEVQSQREIIGAQEADQKQAEIAKKYPFLSELPHATTDFKVDYSLDKSQNLSLQVTLYPTGDPVRTPKTYKKELSEFKQEALDYLRTIGVNINSTPITYTPNPDQ